MAKTIILIRHGKAETRAEGLADEGRALTEAGKRSLAAWLPRAARLLAEEHPGSVQLWASPAVRAQQTAELVDEVFSSALGVKKLEVASLACLWEQDLGEFFAAVDAAPADVVVAVGHNPFMEEAVRWVCGHHVALATGAVAAVRVGSVVQGAFGAEPVDGRLLWVVQGPESKCWKTMVDVERVIGGAVDNVEARRAAFFADPEDVEAAHKYRVSIRTIRGLLAFVKPFFRSDQYRALQHDWRSLVVPTSRLREYDVLWAQVEQLEPRADALLEACAAARARECDAVLRTLSAKASRNTFESACTSSRSLEWRRAFQSTGLGADALSARFDEMVAAVRRDKEGLDLADAERTHDVRKRAKQVRYAAERFGSLVGEAADAPRDVAAQMEAVQDELGALCDARVNVAIIDEFSTKGLPDEALWALSLLRARNEQFIYETLRAQ